MRVLLSTAVLIGSFAGPLFAQTAPPAAVPVSTVIAERKPITKGLDFVGRIEAISRVEVRARVEGYLEAVLFKEGDLVKEGDPLYRIEKGLFEAAVGQAEGALERSEAAKILSEVQLKRAEELLAKNAGTAVARDQAFAADEQAKGAITSDEASLRTAKINLGYTDITAPIAGKIGKTNVTKGNVVGPNTGVLTIIVSQDPMYVSFPVSQREFLRIEAERDRAAVESVGVKIRFSDGTTYDQTGTINFIDVTVDRSTDTVLVRATIPNPKGTLIDGQLVRVLLESDKPEDKVVVPQAALLADQQGTYVFVVDNGKAVVKRLKLGGESGAGVVVDQGLSGGEQVIVEGLQSVRPDAPVRASPMPAALERG
jgi:membrane fusion protein, multidrug efflux system